MAKLNSFTFNKREHVFLILIVLFCAALVYFQSAYFPFVPFTDAICFLPQAVNFAQGDGLRNVYTFNYISDGAYIWHGFLFPLILGGVFKASNYEKVTLALAVINFLNVVILGGALMRMTSKIPCAKRSLFLIACLLAQVGFLQGVIGRPETLSSLLISIGLLIWSYGVSNLICIFLGLITGLLAVTSPLSMVSAGLCLAIAIAYRTKWNFKTLAKYGFIPVFTAIAVYSSFLFYPYTFEQWLWGLEKHASSVIRKGNEWMNVAWILRHYFVSTGRLMMGGIFFCCICAAVFMVSSSKNHKLWQKWGINTLIILFFVFILRYSYASGFYTMLCIFPIGAGVLARFIAMQKTRWLKFSTILKFSALIFLSISCFDPLLLQIGRHLGYRSLSLQEARSVFLEDLKQMPGEITISMDLAVLSDSTSNLKVIYDYVPPCKEPNSRWFVLQQYSFFYTAPPQYENYSLVKNRFVEINALSGRLSQWFGVNGYGYAIYERRQ